MSMRGVVATEPDDRQRVRHGLCKAATPAAADDERVRDVADKLQSCMQRISAMEERLESAAASFGVDQSSLAELERLEHTVASTLAAKSEVLSPGVRLARAGPDELALAEAVIPTVRLAQGGPDEAAVPEAASTSVRLASGGPDQPAVTDTAQIAPGLRRLSLAARWPPAASNPAPEQQSPGSSQKRRPVLPGSRGPQRGDDRRLPEGGEELKSARARICRLSGNGDRPAT